jgi:DNA-binding GntR family transcriptional regulator
MKGKKEHTTSNKIADAIRMDINYGKLEPGKKLIEREIAEKYKTSHVPVREALRILEGEGFIIHEKFSGYCIKVIKAEEMLEAFNILRFLANELLKRAVHRYTEITFFHLNSIVDEMGESKDLDKTVSLFVEFSEVAFAPAGLDYTYNLAVQLVHVNTPILRRMIRESLNGKIPDDIHRVFIELCQKKQYQKAVDNYMLNFDKITKLMVSLLGEKK